MPILILLIALPIEQICEGNEVVDSAWCSQIQISGPILGNLLLPWHIVLEGSFRHGVCLVFYVEKLRWNVCLQIYDGPIVHEKVEVDALLAAKTAQKKILGENVLSIGRLIDGVLSVELQIPRQNVNTSLSVVHDKDLDKIFDAS